MNIGDKVRLPEWSNETQPGEVEKLAIVNNVYDDFSIALVKFRTSPYLLSAKAWFLVTDLEEIK